MDPNRTQQEEPMTENGKEADTEAEHGTQKDLRLVTYNVLYTGVTEGLYPEIDTEPYSWERRRDSVAETLKAKGPDVVAFQEVWMGQFDDLDERLPGYAWVAHDDGVRHTPIAYRSDRFDVVDDGTFWLSEEDADPGEAGWDAANQRLVTHATLRDEDGDEVAVFSVHLDHVGERARKEGARMVREKVTKLTDDTTPVAVAGDFNCQPGSDAYEVMVEEKGSLRGLGDAYETATDTLGPKLTFTGLHGDDSEEELNLDHVFVTDGLEVEGYETNVPEDESEEFRPSDHRPVVVDLRY